MNINISQKTMIQGSFNLHNKKTDDESKNVVKKLDKNNYEDKIKGIEETIKSVQANETDDADAKKEKIQALQDQIKELRRLQQQEELQKLKYEKENKEENPYLQNSDGDKVTLSDQMKEMIKGDRVVKKQEEKAQLKTDLEAKANRLGLEIENDRGRNKSVSNRLNAQASVDGEATKNLTEKDLKRMDYYGYDAKHKGKDLEELEENIEKLDNNELEKITKDGETEKDKDKKVDKKKEEEVKFGQEDLSNKLNNQ